MEIENDRIKFADKFTHEYGVSILLKGARSLVAYGGNNKYISLISTSALAKAAMGDLLAGIIASLNAQGLSLADSAACGCYIHACAGMIAEKEIGAYSVMCDDILMLVPRVIQNIINKGF